jgi:hypothetical protein
MKIDTIIFNIYFQSEFNYTLKGTYTIIKLTSFQDVSIFINQ